MEEIKYRLKSKYIMQDPELVELIKDTTEKHQVILLVAPQGTGKSYYFQNIKTPSIIISPTRALTNQYFTASIKDKYDETINAPNTFFQSVKHIQKLTDKVEFLVIDEIHKAVQYSSFAYQQTDNIIKAFDEFKKSGKPIILATATPDILKCLEGFPVYDDISARIEIIVDKEYVKEVRVMERYSESKVEDLIKERYESNSESMQVVLINDTARVKGLAKKLNKTGIKSIGIVSQNKDPEKNESDKEKSVEDIEVERVFKDLTDNKRIGYSVLIATSWVDVGINFKNRNITDIYCMFDDKYSRGDLTLIWQFMARARDCKPVLYISKPILSDREVVLINKAAKYLSLSDEDVKEDLQNMYEYGHTSKVYDYLYGSFCDIALDLIDKYHDGFVLKDTLETLEGIYFEKGHPNTPMFSPIPIRFLLYKMMEKVSYSDDLVRINTNCISISKCKKQDSYYDLCSSEEISKVKDHLLRLAYDSTEFRAQDQVEELKRISNKKLHVTQKFNSFIENCELDLKLVGRKSGDIRYSRLFFNYDIEQVRYHCDINDVGFSKYGYAKYPIETAKMIKELAPNIEVIPIDKGEVYIDISCLDVPETFAENEELYYLLMDFKHSYIEAHNL